jgi:hypothetical protein
MLFNTYGPAAKKFHDSNRICFLFFLELVLLAKLLSNLQAHFR